MTREFMSHGGDRKLSNPKNIPIRQKGATPEVTPSSQDGCSVIERGSAREEARRTLFPPRSFARDGSLTSFDLRRINLRSSPKASQTEDEESSEGYRRLAFGVPSSGTSPRVGSAKIGNLDLGSIHKSNSRGAGT